MNLTSADWEELGWEVYDRDLRAAYRLAVTELSLPAWLRANPYAACVAPQLDSSLSGTCSGRLTLDHVHDRGMTTMRKKAPDNARHLQIVCEGHHGTNRYSGGWITSHEAREKARDRLAALYA